jgi:hypothetical protein
MKKTDFAAIEAYGEGLKKYAFFRMIFFGVGLITLVIGVILTPQIEILDINNITDGELLSSIEGSLFIWLILILILIFAVTIIGFIVLGMFGKYVIQLKKAAQILGSRFLRNILICEVFRPAIWIVQLFFIGSLNNIPLYLFNCISMGLSLYSIDQLKKWIKFYPDYGIEPSEVDSILANLNVWMFSGIVFLGASFIQIIGFFEGEFLLIIEGFSLLVISVAFWFYGKKIAWIFV